MKVIKDKEIIKKLTGYTRAHRGATRILSIVLCVAVIGTFVVWPSLADEMEPLGDEVEVAVNTPEPTGTPEAEAMEEPAASHRPRSLNRSVFAALRKPQKSRRHPHRLQRSHPQTDNRMKRMLRASRKKLLPLPHRRQKQLHRVRQQNLLQAVKTIRQDRLKFR